MIAERNTDRTSQGNIGQFDSIQMGIAEDATAHIISLLTDLYGDQIGAIIREYATNGRDAQIEAGIDGPIEISLPGPLSPIYSVKDRGVGLDAAGIRSIYSQYGASTKRETNEQNGMLGLGSKSALTYTDQFTIVSVKDGIRTTVIVSRKDDDLPTMTIVDQTPVNLPSGTEVQVPVKQQDIRAFDTKAREFFGYWKDGEALIGGKPNEQIKGLAIGDDMIVVEGQDRYSNDRHKIVMGGVAYPAGDLSVTLPHGRSLIAFVPIGSVRFAPSREALMTTAGTRATMAQVAIDFRDKSVRAVQLAIDTEAKSHSDAVRIAAKWAKSVPGVSRAALTYKGVAIPETLTLDEGTLIVPRNGHKVAAHQKITQLTVADFSETVFVHNYDRASFTATQKKKLVMWADEVNKGQNPARQFIMCGTRPVSAWLESATYVAWSTVDALKLPKVGGRAGSSGRIPGSYDFYEGATFRTGVEDTEIDSSYPVFHFNGPRHMARPYVEMLKASGLDDFTVAVLGDNRIGKFCRNFPQATRVVDAIDGLFDKWAAKLTQDERLAISMADSGSTGTFRGMDPALFDDPKIKEAIRLSKVDISAAQSARKAFQNVTRRSLSGLGHFVNPMADYPLASNIYGQRHMDHVALYANAVYAASKA